MQNEIAKNSLLDLTFGDKRKPAEEYAKQMSVTFLEWACFNYTPFYEGKYLYWHRPYDEIRKQFGTEELYDNFLKSL